MNSNIHPIFTSVMDLTPRGRESFVSPFGAMAYGEGGYPPEPHIVSVYRDQMRGQRAFINAADYAHSICNGGLYLETLTRPAYRVPLMDDAVWYYDASEGTACPELLASSELEDYDIVTVEPFSTEHLMLLASTSSINPAFPGSLMARILEAVMRYEEGRRS